MHTSLVDLANRYQNLRDSSTAYSHKLLLLSADGIQEHIPLRCSSDCILAVGSHCTSPKAPLSSIPDDNSKHENPGNIHLVEGADHDVSVD